jgi:hypothetical protein
MKTLLLFTFLGCLLISGANASEKIDSTKIELAKLSPEPFHDFLKFEFKVHDGKQHNVRITIMNSNHERVYSERMLVYEGHEDITINTSDFYMQGIYSIQIRLDGRYVYKRTNKRE